MAVVIIRCCNGWGLRQFFGRYNSKVRENLYIRWRSGRLSVEVNDERVYQTFRLRPPTWQYVKKQLERKGHKVSVAEAAKKEVDFLERQAEVSAQRDPDVWWKSRGNFAKD